MGILDALRDIQASERGKASAEYRRILHAESGGKGKASDAPKLAGAMKVLDKTPEDLASDLDVVRQANELQAVVTDLDLATLEVRATEAAMAADAGVWQRRIDEVHRQRQAALMAKARATGDLRQALEQRDALENLQNDNPDLF